MDKLKVYQKFYQLPEFTRNFMYFKTQDKMQELSWRNEDKLRKW